MNKVFLYMLIFFSCTVFVGAGKKLNNSMELNKIKK